MTYELKFEPVIIDKVTYPKYNVYYTGGLYHGLHEFHSIDGINGTIRDSYTLKVN